MTSFDQEPAPSITTPEFKELDIAATPVEPTRRIGGLAIHSDTDSWTDPFGDGLSISTHFVPLDGSYDGE